MAKSSAQITSVGGKNKTRHTWRLKWPCFILWTDALFFKCCTECQLPFQTGVVEPPQTRKLLWKYVQWASGNNCAWKWTQFAFTTLSCTIVQLWIALPVITPSLIHLLALLSLATLGTSQGRGRGWRPVCFWSSEGVGQGRQPAHNFSNEFSHGDYHSGCQ